MNLIKFLALSSIVFCFACTPDPLEGFEADGGTTKKTDTSVKTDTSTTDDMGGGGGDEASPEFMFVAEAFRMKCGQVTCHGASSNNGLKVVLGTDSTDREVFDAIMTTTLSVDGDPFIVAGNATASNYTIRMERDAADPGFMPLGGTKEQADLDKINAWINAGAKFN